MPFVKRGFGMDAIKFERLSNRRWGRWDVARPVRYVVANLLRDAEFEAFDYVNLGEVCTYVEGYALNRIRQVAPSGRGVWVRTYGRWVLLTPDKVVR